MSREQKNKIKQVCGKLGRKNIYSRLGVGKSALSNAESEGYFRSDWWKVINSLCDESGIECSEDWFSWREASPKSGSASGQDTGGAS